jgi:hypothetical protein
VQRPELGVAGEGCLGLLRRRPGVVEAQVDERVEARVAGLDALDRRLEDLHRREVARADAPRQLDHRRVGQLLGQPHPRSSRDRVGAECRPPW